MNVERAEIPVLIGIGIGIGIGIKMPSDGPMGKP